MSTVSITNPTKHFCSRLGLCSCVSAFLLSPHFTHLDYTCSFFTSLSFLLPFSKKEGLRKDRLPLLSLIVLARHTSTLPYWRALSTSKTTCRVAVILNIPTPRQRSISLCADNAIFIFPVRPAALSHSSYDRPEHIRDIFFDDTYSDIPSRFFAVANSASDQHIIRSQKRSWAS